MADGGSLGITTPKIRFDAWDWTLRVAILVFLGVIVYLSIAGRVFEPWLRIAQTHQWAAALLRPSLLWMSMGAVLLAFRTFLWFRYRAHPAATMRDAPALTVVVPAYNEGAMVALTIDSLAAADYPRERLEIVVVDDGSRDDTWTHIENAARRHPGLVTTLRFPRNRGKRAALEAGFRRARGEIVVTVDSDSVIERATLLAIAGPFRDARVGAVAGRVAVYNRRAGLIPRMLHIRYTLSFDVLRATQSTYGTVYCCPGALSAYRLSVVRAVLDRWVGQTFLGAPTTFGEDRALTNYVLEQGYDTVYQRDAVVHTVVPESYRKLCKMYLRWDRSFVREELRFATIVWRRPLKAMLIAVIDSTITNLRFPVSYFVLVLFAMAAVAEPVTILRLMVAIGLMSTFYSLFYLTRERSFDVVYGIVYAYFSFFTLFWVFPYAVMTVRARGWLTR